MAAALISMNLIIQWLGHRDNTFDTSEIQRRRIDPARRPAGQQVAVNSEAYGSTDLGPLVPK